MYVCAGCSLHKGTWWQWRSGHRALGSGTQPLPDHKAVQPGKGCVGQEEGEPSSDSPALQEPAHGGPLFFLRHREGQAAALGELGDCLWRKGSCVEPQPRILWFLWATITSLLPQVETPLEVHRVLARGPNLFWCLWSPSGALLGNNVSVLVEAWHLIIKFFRQKTCICTVLLTLAWFPKPSCEQPAPVSLVPRIL